MVRVNEVFATIQGEAFYTGTASVFIRLQYCPVGCPWCDTKYTWDDVSVAGSVDSLFERAETAGGIDIDHEMLLAKIIERFPTIKHIVVTGGEPCAQNIKPLLETAHQLGFSTQVETSGTFPIDVPYKTWVTLSPKIDMPNNYAVRRDALTRANEIKQPVGKADDIVKLERFIGDTPITMIWLQPLSQSAKATKICVDFCLTNSRYRLSAQIHKYLDLP